MTSDIFFFIVLFSQIILVSYIYPAKMLARVQTIFNNYPPEQFPKLYPESIERYKQSAKNYERMNHIIVVIGLGLMAYLFLIQIDKNWIRAVITWYFSLQFLPNFLFELWTSRYHKLMRLLNPNTQREADLSPRKLIDYIPQSMLIVVFTIYVIFVGFIIFIDQFNFPWFEGYLNILIVTAVYGFFGALISRAIYGKIKNPHQDYKDRKLEIKNLGRQLSLMLIALVLYAMMTISLKALEMNWIRPITLSIYFQLIVYVAMQWPSLDSINFDVYRKTNPEILPS